MESWLKDKPVEAFPIPSGIVFQKVGGALMAFAEDRMPTQSVAKGDQTPAQEQELEPGLEQAQTPPEGGAGTPPPANPPSNSSSSFFKSDLF
jgi:hypothetical protein